LPEINTQPAHFVDQRRPVHAQPCGSAALTTDHAFCLFKNLKDVQTLRLFRVIDLNAFDQF
jgi:hypothetical protein